MTCVTDFGGTSVCRTESLIQSEIPYEKREKQPFICGDACPMPEKHELLNTFRATARAVLLLVTLGLFCVAQAEEADGATRESGDSSEPAAEFLLIKDLFSDDSLFGRLAERVRFSGFARVVGGALDAEDASYLGYENSINFSQHSLFALQTEVDLTETFSFTTQLLAHASEDRDTGLEWAYLTWRPSNRWNFKAGRLRTPFYFHSDTLDLGYAYPWIIPPQQVYTPYLFPNFTGLSAAYQFNIWDFDIETEAYWGNFEGKVSVADNALVDVKADNLRGLILDVYRGNLRLRASYHLAHADIKFPPAARLRAARLIEQLRQEGFPKSADSLKTKSDVSFAQAAISYEALDYFLKAEWTSLRKTDAHSLPPYDSYYLSGGYTFHPFNLPITAHATYASFRTKGDRRPDEEILRGVSPQQDSLRDDYIRAFNSVLGDDLDSLSAGLRWDVNPAIALKAEWVHLRGERDKRSFFTFDQATNFDRKANLFLLGLEWVF